MSRPSHLPASTAQKRKHPDAFPLADSTLASYATRHTSEYERTIPPHSHGQSMTPMMKQLEQALGYNKNDHGYQSDSEGLDSDT